MENPLQKHRDDLYRALGRLVHEWTVLEGSVSNIVMTLFALKGKNFYEDNASAKVGLVLSNNLDLRANIAIAKALAFDVDDPTDFFSRLEPILNQVGNDLRNERNRFIHDSWSVLAPTRIVRYRRGTKLTKEPATGAKKLSTIRRQIYSSIAEVEKTVEAIAKQQNALELLRSELRETQKRKFQT